MGLILGIDEAGRGPLIGPMAIAGCLIDEKIEIESKKLGVKDSKLLLSKKRELLAKKIKEKAIAYHVLLIHPYEIDSKIKSGVNLNRVEAEKAAEIINQLSKKIEEPLKVVIDCPSPNKELWKKYVLRKITKQDNIFVVCEHKADKNHIAVSAASILAKCAREREVAKLKKKIGKDFGSGYSHDPKTQEFLRQYSKEHKKDGIFRETWQTWQNHKKQKEQKKLEDF